MFLKLEIFVFFISFFYIIYYVFFNFLNYFKKVKKNIIKGNISEFKTVLNKIDLNSQENKENLENQKNLSSNEREIIHEIIKKARINLSKGYISTAKSLVVEGLSIDKKNKELNLELASIYEEEENFLSALYIYEDLAKFYKSDFNIIKKIGNINFLLGNNTKALENYEILFKKKEFDLEVLDNLSSIYFLQKDYLSSLKYVKSYLKDKPRDVEKITLKAVCLEKLGKSSEALEVYNKVLDLHPYDTFAKNKVKEIINKNG